jgi:hypothetical protein
MATIGRANNASYLNTARLSYISTAPFYNYFFTYTTMVNSQGTTVGVFSPVSGATVSNCPAARVLRETGRKLYPGANPNVNTYMVSVYDQQTQLTGFIDPNSSVWCIYNNDKPNFWPDGVDPTTLVTDQGLSIYTLGNVTSQGFISTASYLNVAGNALVVGNVSTLGNLLVAGVVSSLGTITSGDYIFAKNGVGYTTGSGGTIVQGSGSGKATAVTLNKLSGQITMDGAQLNAGTAVAFTLNNSFIGVGDTLILNSPTNTSLNYVLGSGYCIAGSCAIYVRNITGGNLSDALVIKFTVIKSTTA